METKEHHNTLCGKNLNVGDSIKIKCVFCFSIKNIRRVFLFNIKWVNKAKKGRANSVG